MPLFKPKTPLDKAFAVSLLLKGLDGLFETVSGILFLFIPPRYVLDVAHGVVGYQPHGFIGKHILESAQHFGKGAAIFAALYLLSHGVVKLVLIVEILREHLWAYIGLIVVTAVFMLYQIWYIIFRHPTFSFVFLTLFDGVVIFLTTKEYIRHKELLAKHHRQQTE